MTKFKTEKKKEVVLAFKHLDFVCDLEFGI
jgi:hypothetical protein